MPARLRAPAWVAALAAGIAATAGYFALPGGAQPWGNFAVGSTAAAAVALGARRHGGPSAGPWLLIAAWLAVFAAGDALLPTDQGATSSPLGFAPWADLCYLLGYALAVAGFGWLALRRVRGNRGGLSDASVAGLAVGAALWVVVVAPASHAGATLADRVLATAYPMLDIFLLTLVASAALAGALQCWSLRLLAGGVATMLLGDLELAWERTHVSFDSGDLADVWWLLSYTLVAAAALHPGAARVAVPAHRQEVRLTRARRRLLLVACLVPSLAILLRHDSLRTNELVGVALAGGLMAALLAARLSTFASEQERRAEGERGLRFAAAELAGASDREGIAAAVLAGAVGLLPDACEIRVNLLEGDTLHIAPARHLRRPARRDRGTAAQPLRLRRPVRA